MGDSFSLTLKIPGLFEGRSHTSLERSLVLQLQGLRLIV